MYAYEGVSLLEYCKNNGICYSSQVRKIKKYQREYPNLSFGELTKKAISSCGTRDKYYYEGMTLRAYCKKEEINYDTIHRRIVRLRERYPNMPIEELIEKALSQTSMVKYFYQGKSLYMYCQENGFDINLMSEKIKRLIDSKNISLDEAIEEAVEYYKQKKYNQTVTKIFKYLKGNNNPNEKVIEKIIKYLNIDCDNLKKLIIEKKFNIKTAIALIWFFYDSKPEMPLSISSAKLKDILKYIRNITNFDNTKAENLNFGYLFGIYKTGIYDTRYLILLHQKNFILSVIYKTMHDFNLNLSKNEKEEIYDEISVHFLELLDKIDNNIIGKVITYLIKATKGFVIDYFIEFKKRNRQISLQGKSTNDDRMLIEKLNVSEEHTELHFSSRIMSIIAESVDLISKKFIIYRYEYNLNYEQIASLLQLSIVDIKELEYAILAKLRENETLIKSLKK